MIIQKLRFNIVYMTVLIKAYVAYMIIQNLRINIVIQK